MLLCYFVQFFPQRCDLHNKVSKKFLGLIITFKIEPGNKPLVTEDYRLFFKKQILSSAQMFPLKLDCIILPHQIKCLFGIRVSSSKLLHNSSAVGLGDIKALAFLKLKKKKTIVPILFIMTICLCGIRR